MSPSRKRLIAALAFVLPAVALVAAPPAMAKQQTSQSQSHKAKGTHAGSKSKHKSVTKKPKKTQTAAS